MKEIYLLDLLKFTKFSPAAQEKVKNLASGLLKFSKFSPAALKKEEGSSRAKGKIS